MNSDRMTQERVKCLDLICLMFKTQSSIKASRRWKPEPEAKNQDEAAAWTVRWMIQLDIRKNMNHSFLYWTNFGPVLGSDLTGHDLGAHPKWLDKFSRIPTTWKLTTEQQSSPPLSRSNQFQKEPGSKVWRERFWKWLHNMLNLIQLQKQQHVPFHDRTTTLHHWHWLTYLIYIFTYTLLEIMDFVFLYLTLNLFFSLLLLPLVIILGSHD